MNRNIADNGGVKEAFAAYRERVKNHGDSQLLPDLDYTSDQLFFLSYAKVSD